MTPIARREDGESSAPDPTSTSAGSPARSQPRRPAVILIADDTTDTRELYADYFASHGFTVVTAHDGTRAVQAALDHVPDVVVMDIAMPQIDGITAVRRIKADPRMVPTRVIVLTGYPRAGAERGAFEAGADMFLTKPCLPEVLERYVNRLRRPRRPVP